MLLQCKMLFFFEIFEALQALLRVYSIQSAMHALLGRKTEIGLVLLQHSKLELRDDHLLLVGLCFLVSFCVLLGQLGCHLHLGLL